MAHSFRIGQRVAVNVGGCIENRTFGVIRSIRERPALTTYEVALAEHRGDVRVATFYTAESLEACD
jgi:hypothetical protein